MLPNGRLAKHGYSVDYGYGFVGTCMGSHELPFEISRDFLAKMVTDLNTCIANHVPAVARPIDGALSALLRESRRYVPNLTAAEKAEVAAYRKAVEHNQQQESRLRFVAYQTPRLTNWSVKPLKERDAEESIADTKKAANKGIRLALAHVKTAKRDLTRLIESARSLGSRFNSERTYAKSMEEYELNSAFFRQANKAVNDKCALLSGTSRSALKVAANIRSLFSDDEALAIAHDLEVAHRAVEKAHEAYAAFAA